LLNELNILDDMNFSQSQLTKLIASLIFIFNVQVVLFAQQSALDSKPNVLLIFADDLGYGDLSCYGAQDVNTPALDQLAREGLRCTDFHVAAPVCGPSRASLMTGRYPMRCGQPGFPGTQSKTLEYEFKGLHPDEMTISSLLKEAGYATMCIGKWHLGLEDGFHPTDRGFDEFYGIESNWVKTAPKLHRLYEGKKLVNDNVPYESLMSSYTDRAIRFMTENKEEPFFLYLAHNAVHSPIMPSPEFIGTSKGSLYGDYTQELDFYVGKVLESLTDLGLDDHTLVIFLSDNGPAVCHFGGSAGPLNGGKYCTMEGGFRIPAIFRWPGKVAIGDCNTLLSSMDLFPTIAALGGAEMPRDRIYDGEDILPILQAGKGKSPHEFYYYYNGMNLQAIRKGPWKLHLPRTLSDQPFWSNKGTTEPFRGTNLKNISCKGLEVLDRLLLFNLDTDMGELTDVSNQYPEIVQELLKEADRVRTELGDVEIIGSDQRVPPFEKIID
jgi:arylsulfatase